MIEAVGPALLGLLAGLAARALLPGHPAISYFTSALLGTTGGWFAAFVGAKAGLYRARDRVALLMSVLGAMALLLLYSLYPLKPW